MKSLELKPTYGNLLNSLIHDTIGRNKDICRFADIINYIPDSCTIALDGNWGSGKTFFVKQTKMLLDAHNDFIKTMNEDDCYLIKSIYKPKQEDVDFEPQVCVYYDAWENDNDNDPVLSLIYSIVSDVNNDFEFSDDTDVFKKAAAVLDFFTEKNWGSLVDALKGETPLSAIREQKEIQTEIKEFFDSLLLERGNRLVVFIDELDRCKPSYAVKLLERIKHYFDNDRVTFVFSINTLELQHTIKKHYGDDFDACRYLDRFFDLRVTLPQADISKFYASIDFNKSAYVYDSMCDEIIKKYNFSLREISKFLRLARIAAFEPTHSRGKFDFSFPEEKGVKFCLVYIIPLMIGLSVYKRELYEQFINGENFDPLIELLSNKDTYWFDDLLSHNETFDEGDTGRTVVSLKDKLIAVYNALFVTKYDNISTVSVGKYSFSKNTKSILLNTTGLLSPYTNLYTDTEE